MFSQSSFSELQTEKKKNLINQKLPVKLNRLELNLDSFFLHDNEICFLIGGESTNYFGAFAALKRTIAAKFF